MLLQDLGRITLRPGAGIGATAVDIVSNPKNVQLRELDAGMLGRSIGDVDAAVVNTNWALKSKLATSDVIATEPAKDNPYRNLIVVKTGHQHDPWARTLLASYQNDTVREALKRIYKGTVVPGW